MSVKNTIRKGAKIAVVAGTIGAGLYLGHELNEEGKAIQERTEAAKQEFYQKGCNVLTAEQQDKEGIQSIHFTKTEAGQLAKFLQNEKSLGQLFVKRVIESINDPYCQTMNMAVDSALKATLKSGYGYENDVENAVQVYQIFKTAIVRQEGEKTVENAKTASQKGLKSLGLGMDEKVSNIIQNLKRSRE